MPDGKNTTPIPGDEFGILVKFWNEFKTEIQKESEMSDDLNYRTGLETAKVIALQIIFKQ